MTSVETQPLPKAQPGSLLTLHYRLAGPQGDIINTFGGQPATLTLGASELTEAVEQRLIGIEEGAHQTFQLPAGAAFGERNPDMQQWVSLRILKEFGDPGDTYEIGEVVEFPGPNGQGRMAGTVRQKGTESVLFDFNHPLAGQPVSFEVKIIGIL